MIKYFSVAGGLVGAGITILFGELHLSWRAGASLFIIYLGLIFTCYEIKKKG